jgi:RimJ/RimL family protein N-acetyltransferase
MSKILLHPVGQDGNPSGLGADIPPDLVEALKQTTRHYEREGFNEPWISYVGAMDGVPIGICAFKSAPVGGRVEIAYYTLAVYEGRGFATGMAAQLIAIARRHDSSLLVTAQTLPARGPSHRVLEKLRFRHAGEVSHPEDGLVWEWHLIPGA